MNYKYMNALVGFEGYKLGHRTNHDKKTLCQLDVLVLVMYKLEEDGRQRPTRRLLRYDLSRVLECDVKGLPHQIIENKFNTYYGNASTHDDGTVLTSSLCTPPKRNRYFCAPARDQWKLNRRGRAHARALRILAGQINP